MWMNRRLYHDVAPFTLLALTFLAACEDATYKASSDSSASAGSGGSAGSHATGAGDAGGGDAGGGAGNAGGGGTGGAVTPAEGPTEPLSFTEIPLTDPDLVAPGRGANSFY